MTIRRILLPPEAGAGTAEEWYALKLAANWCGIELELYYEDRLPIDHPIFGHDEISSVEMMLALRNLGIVPQRMSGLHE